MAAKTKTVILYADLYPDWHKQVHSFVLAQESPPQEKPEHALRVKIVCELPEHTRLYPHDAEASEVKTVV